MKKLLTLAVALCCTLAFAGCSPVKLTPVSSVTPPSSEEPSSQGPQKDMTIEEIAEKNNAAVYNIADKKPVNFETSTVNADNGKNKIGGMSIESVKYYDNFQAGKDAIANAIVFDTVADTAMAEDFLTNKAYVSLHNAKGDTYDKISSGIYYDAETEKLYMVFYCDEDITAYDTILLGGFAEDKNNGYNNFVFPITK